MSNPATTEPVLVDKAKVTTSPVWTHFGYWVNKEVNPTASDQSSAICRAVGSSRASRALALPLLGLDTEYYYKLFTEQGMQ